VTVPLAGISVILLEPLDPVNIAGVVRAMKNMGADSLRLVRPVAYLPERLESVAPGTGDLIERIARFDTLDDAVADCVRLAGFTARRRAAKRDVATPRAAARGLLEAATGGTVGLLFGREDHGLPNDALDRCHVVVTIPTTDHASLNLAQAVLLALYELHCAAGVTRAVAPARKDAPPAVGEQYERLFHDAERALAAIDFFRTRNRELILRTVRTLAHRASPDAREIELARAMAIEVIRALDRARERA